MDRRWGEWRRNHTAVIRGRNTDAAWRILDLELADEGRENCAELDVRKLLTDTPVPARTEGKVRRGGTLSDDTEAKVDLLATLKVLVLGGGPALWAEVEWLREILGVNGGGTRGGEDVVAIGDDEVGVGDAHVGLDLAEDGVEWWVHAESLLNDVHEVGALHDALVVERTEGAIGLAIDLDLFVVELVGDLGVSCEVEKSPADGSHRSVLSSHEKRNHNVSNLGVVERAAILVRAVHEVRKHIRLLVGVGILAALLDEVLVGLRDGLVGSVTLAVVRERNPWEHEVKGLETHIEVVVELCKLAIELIADFLALESAGSSEDGNLGYDLEERDGAGLALEVGVLLEVVGDLLNNERNIGLEGLSSKTKLDELFPESAPKSPQSGGDNRRFSGSAYLLLLNEDVVGDIVDDVLAENRGGEAGVGLLRVDLRDFAVKNQIVALGAERHRHLGAEKNESEDIAILLGSAPHSNL